MPLPTSIDQVIDALTTIIDYERTQLSRLAYFPALYRRVTREVQRGMATGKFTDSPRMGQLDVIFANRYLLAYEEWRAGRPVNQCWALAFDAAARTDRTITQHLLLGMNAHINLDLAVAAATVEPGDAIYALHGDFQQINKILFEQVNAVQDAIASVAPMMRLLDVVGGENEERLVEFSLTKAREAAWMQAVMLAGKSGAEQEEAIRAVDCGVALIGAGVLDPPGFLMRSVLRSIVRSEIQDVARIIDALQ